VGRSGPFSHQPTRRQKKRGCSRLRASLQMSKWYGMREVLHRLFDSQTSRNVSVVLKKVCSFYSTVHSNIRSGIAIRDYSLYVRSSASCPPDRRVMYRYVTGAATGLQQGECHEIGRLRIGQCAPPKRAGRTATGASGGSEPDLRDQCAAIVRPPS